MECNETKKKSVLGGFCYEVSNIFGIKSIIFGRTMKFPIYGLKIPLYSNLHNLIKYLYYYEKEFLILSEKYKALVQFYA